MINLFQTGIEPVGHFDFLDSELSSMRGGEVVVLDQIPVGVTDLSTPDVWNDPPIRVAARRATRTDRGPFYLADSNRSTIGESEVGFETSTLFSTSTSFIRPDNVSGKLSLWAAEGFYSISTDVIADDIDSSTPIYAPLYSDNNGLLTATVSSTAQIVGYFIEYRDKNVVDQELNRFQYAGTSKTTDTIIIYKSNADGYNTADAISAITAKIGVIGEPTDGTYTDGFFVTFDENTRIADAIDEISEAFLQLAPARADVLTSTDLTISGTTLFSARVPSGLAAAWYTGGVSAGDTITTLIIDNTYILTTADSGTRFRAGRDSDPTTAGTLTHLVNGVSTNTYDIGALGTGTLGPITVSDLSTYNTFWLKANANLSITQTTEGRETHALSHTEAGVTNTRTFHYDDVNTSPSFDVSPAVAENTPVDGYLSGIIHYATGSTFDLSYTAASGIFEKTYHPTEVSRIELTGAPNTAVNPGATPAFNDTFVVSGQTITLSTADQAAETPQATVRLFKPNGDTASATAAVSRPINTYGTASTATTESFVDEARRLTALASTSPDFDSTAALTDGYAQVYISGSNGTVGFPRVGDYPGFVAAEQIYQRHFTKASASSGTIVFGGFTIANIDSYGTGDTNVLLRLDTDGLWFDAGLAFGANNGTGSGDSPANSIGCQVGTSSGSTLDFTFGINSTATNANQYRVQLIFRNTNDTITSLTTS